MKRTITCILAAILELILQLCAGPSEPSAFLSKSGLSGASFVCNEEMLVASGSGSVAFWNINSKRETRTITLSMDSTHSVCRIPNTNQIMCVNGGSRIIVFGMKNGMKQNEIILPVGINHIESLDQGRSVAAACADGSVRIVDLKTKKELYRLNGGFFSMEPEAQYVSASGDGKLLAVSYNGINDKADNQILVWDTETKRVVKGFKVGSKCGEFCQFVGKGLTHLAFPGSDAQSLCYWDSDPRNEPKVAARFGERVIQLAHSVSSSVAVVACLDGSIYIVRDSKAPQLLHRFPPGSFIETTSLAADDKHLAVAVVSGTQSKLFVWNLASRKTIARPIQEP